jgi:hypothetical protein
LADDWLRTAAQANAASVSDALGFERNTMAFTAQISGTIVKYYASGITGWRRRIAQAPKSIMLSA